MPSILPWHSDLVLRKRAVYAMIPHHKLQLRGCVRTPFCAQRKGLSEGSFVVTGILQSSLK